MSTLREEIAKALTKHGGDFGRSIDIMEIVARRLDPEVFKNILQAHEGRSYPDDPVQWDDMVAALIASIMGEP